jgi:glutamate 5-kinase
MAGGSASGLGTGGMLTKLQAADLARRGGATVVIALGSDLSILSRLIAGEFTGTRFMPSGTALDSRKRYLLAGGPPAGSLIVDEGAVRALRRGNSLLPVGVLAVEGDFERGDPVLVVGPGQKSDLPNRSDVGIRDIARGLVNYPAGDLRRILGLQSDQIEPTLGFVYAEEVIHRNNMVML